MNGNDITQQYGSQLDRGRKRRNNQDSIATAKMNQLAEDNTQSIGIYIIADGVAKAPDGEIASKLAVDVTMRDLLLNRDTMVEHGTYTQQMKASVKLAHETILHQYEDHRELPATTLVMAVVVETQAYILNVGDSRAYVLADGFLRQITTDHTFSQELLLAGALTQTEADQHPMRNTLSRHLGGRKDFEPDVFVENLVAGDYLLLCSDGLYNLVEEDMIVHILQTSETPQLATDRLTQAANDAGGRDNIAVVVIEMKDRK